MGNVNATSNLKNFVDGSKEFSSGIITQVGSYIGYSKGESTVEIIIYIIIALVVVLFIVWAYGITQQQNVECSNLIVSESHIDLLKNSTIDWKDSLMEAGFDIINPQAKQPCGCGESVNF